MFLDAPPGFPVVFSVFAVNDTMFLMMRSGVSSTVCFWHDGVWGGPEERAGTADLAGRISDGVALLWTGDMPEGLLDSLVRQLRDPSSLMMALDVMDS